MIKRIPLEKLILDYNIYPRTEVDNVHITAMTNAVLTGTVLPPIVVDRASLRIVDGWHRYTRAKRAGETDIECDVVAFKDEKAVFEAAVAANASHGRSYAPFDQKRIVKIASDLGLEIERIAVSLHIPKAKVEEIKLGFAKVAIREIKVQPAIPLKAAKTQAFEDVPLKNTVRHLAGKVLTTKQADGNVKAGGMNQLFYVNQIINLLENDLLDFSNVRLTDRLQYLKELLPEKVRDLELAA